MYFDDHNPPHFHAIYAGNEAQIAIEPIGIIEGKLPALHQRELRINWHRLHHEQPAGRAFSHPRMSLGSPDRICGSPFFES
jgi:hypothetical protein